MTSLLPAAVRAAVATAAALLVLAGPAAAQPPSTGTATEGRQVAGAGQHVDALYPVVEDRRLVVKAMAPGGITEPEKLVLHVPDVPSARVGLPAGYEFLGPAGSPAWITAQTQNPDVVWPGWSTEGIGKGVLQESVTFTMTGFSYAGPAAAPRFAVTSAGGLTGEKVSKVFVPGSLFTKVAMGPRGHQHAAWAFTAPGTYDIDFTVSAKLADATPVVDQATVRVVVGALDQASGVTARVAVPEAHNEAAGLALTPDKVDGEYFTGQTIKIMATGKAVIDGAAVRWYLKLAGDPAFALVDDQKSAVYTDKPDRALDGAQVYAELLDPAGAVVEKSPTTALRVAALPASTTVLTKADKPTYRAGETATITSRQDPPTTDEHYHWYLRKPGADNYVWIPESRDADVTVPITPDLDGAEVTVRLFNADHAALAESAPITLRVDGAPAAPVMVSGGDRPVAVGDTFTATAATTAPAAGFAWFLRKSAENPLEPIADAHAATVEHPVGADWEGAQLVVRALDGAGAPIGEASVPRVRLTAATQENGPGPVLWFGIGGAALAALVLGLVLRGRRSAAR